MEIKTAFDQHTNVESPPKPERGHKLLNIFVGKWHTEGQTSPGPFGRSKKIIGTDTYEWLRGGFFLVHHVDVLMGNEEMQAIEIIGYDPSSETYLTHAFDSQGNYGTYEGSFRDGVWRFTTKAERATVLFSYTGKTMTIKWEKSKDGSTWHSYLS